jgi:signal transduction histidine kinase
MSMDPQSILTVVVTEAADIVAVRQRARRIAELLGFDTQDQTRIAAAVSETARTAFARPGDGGASFYVDGALFMIRMHSTRTPPGVPGGVPDWDGPGIAAARRLVDRFSVEDLGEHGHAVTVGKTIPQGRVAVTGESLAHVTRQLAQETADDPHAVIHQQNQELLRSLLELTLRQEEAERLNDELERTNKSVVALYAELDRRAAALQELNETLEARIGAAVAERERVEESLRQSQKMEAVGQLTGGIAHDFNNMLTGVIGGLEIMRRRIAMKRFDDVDRFIEAASASAQRAAGLTHRLLAFSRRQSLDARPVDVNVLARGMEDLLRRTLGENVGLTLALLDDLWPVEADPNQLESALLNLAINARDAMPEGGLLTIETAHVALDQRYVEGKQGLEPGDFVILSVSDTGVGMSPTVIQRAFEPFFTTKAVGSGTGLGLSMVYGFVKQSRGHVEIYSQPGKGTTIKLLLPRTRDAAEAAAAPVAAASPKRALLGETVLIVEDEDAVRMLVAEVLRELGYVFHQAADADAALPILRSDRRLDLLVADVGLPGMNGRQLAETARALRPGLKVLFITGYAEIATESDGFLEAGMAMITKPFTVDMLAEKIRGLIETPCPPAG